MIAINFQKRSDFNQILYLYGHHIELKISETWEIIWKCSFYLQEYLIPKAYFFYTIPEFDKEIDRVSEAAKK